jgi:branched-subunit amino acid transport protein
MSISTAELWFAIVGLAFGSRLLRFSFLGIIGNAELPEWIKRHLRYTLVAVLPGIIAPVLFMPHATDGASSAAFFGRAGNAAGGRLERQSLACHRRRRRYALFIVELWLLTYPTIKIRAFIPVLAL